MAADWSKIEAEYITTETSYRKLAEKYNVDQATIARRAKKDNWISKRQQHADKTQAKLLTADANQKVNRAIKLYSATDQLLNKIIKGLEAVPIITPTAAKNYSDALKNIKEIHMIRTDEDIEEQQMRIAKLKKDIQDDDKNKTIVVTLEGDLSRYAK